jgi:DNA invertase Pin-like site-specific DNA recombinase
LFPDFSVFPGTKKENSEGMAERNRSPWGWRNGVRKLTPDEARAIYELKDSGMTQRAVGEKFGISGSNVFYIWKGATWWRDVAGMKNFDEKLTKR